MANDRRQRPIDAPSLPPRRGLRVPPKVAEGAPGIDPEEDEPTLSEAPVFKATDDLPLEDARELARRLADEARAELAATAEDTHTIWEPHGAAEVTDPGPAEATHKKPPEPQTPEDPRALAVRLAAEAKARHQSKPPEAKTVARPDAAELARKVAQEAKEKLQAKAAPPKEDPRELAKRLVAEAKAKSKAPAPRREAAPEPVPALPAAPPAAKKKKSRLASRAPKKRLSAAEAMAAAKKRESAIPQSVPAPAPAPVEAPEPAPPSPVKAEQPEPAPAPASRPKKKRKKRPQKSPTAAVFDLLPSAAVEEPICVADRNVFAALWKANKARALAANDLRLVATASVLIDAAARVPEAKLYAAKATIGGVAYAVWADIERDVLLGIAENPEIYLAGL